jgi:beta-N-acetylhexosaminidase
MSSLFTLREKIGQMLMVGFRGAEPAECSLIERDLRDHAVGGIVLFDQEMVDATARRRNVVSPDQVKRLVAHLQASARQPGTLLVSIDQEGGRVNRLKADYGFPPSVSQDELGQLDQLDETTRQARLTARTLARVGINFNLAPVVDLDANPNNPIIKGKRRCFSADPELTARHASAVVQAHRDEGVLTCLKHFPGTRPTGSCRYAVARDSHVTCSKDGVQDVRTVPVVWLPVASRDGKEITGGADDHAQD